MKKYLFCIIVLSFSLNCSVSAQKNTNQLIAEFSKAENVENVKIRRGLMSLIHMFGIANDPVAKQISSLHVVELSNCSEDVKNDFLKQTKAIKDGDGYETLIMVKEKGENVRIMLKKKKNTIKELVIFVHEDKSPVIVRLKGNIKEKDIAELTNQYKKQK